MSTNADWANVPLSEAVDFLDSRRRPVKVGDRAKIRGDIPYYGASGIVDYVNDYIFDESLILLGEDGENILSRAVPLAFKISGRSWVNNHAHVLRPRPEFDIGFLTQYLESLDYSTLNTGSAQPKLNKHSCSLIRVVKPPLVEQRRIARCLEDAEALIAALERLIAKKQAIKQGMMQQLLTGRTRLSGFSGEWRDVRIGEISCQHRHSIDPRQEPSRTFQHFSLPAFDCGQVPVIEDGARIDSIKFVVPPEALLVSKLNPRIPRIWAPKDIGSNAISSTEFIVMTASDGMDRSYLTWLMKSESLQQRMKLLATGTTGSHARVHPKMVAAMSASIPEIKEQRAIAQVLDDCEAEIEVLRSRLDKARDIKTGMMQQLLTGRVRLPVDTES